MKSKKSIKHIKNEVQLIFDGVTELTGIALKNEARINKIEADLSKVISDLKPLNIKIGEAVANIKSPKIDTLRAELNKLTSALSTLSHEQGDLKGKILGIQAKADHKEAFRIANSIKGYGVFCENCGHSGTILKTINY